MSRGSDDSGRTTAGPASWPVDNAERICRALATEGGHLFIGPGGYSLRYERGSRLSGYDVETMKAACATAGLPVIDSRMVDAGAAVGIALRGPMIAVGELADPPPWHSFTFAPLRHVAGLYGAAGAEVLNLPGVTSARADAAPAASPGSSQPTAARAAVIPLITVTQRQQLLANGATFDTDEGYDPYPVVKLFTPDGRATWLLTHIEPECPDIAFGLCDLGMDCPEMGSVSLSEIAALRGRLGLPVERDLHFVATKPLSAYARDARRAGTIVTG